MSERLIDLPTYENLKGMMGEDFIGELLDAYFEDSPRLIAQLRQALADRDADSFRTAAHSFKSTSASFGALNLAAIARALEQAGKEGALDGIGPRLEELCAEYGQVELALKELRDAKG